MSFITSSKNGAMLVGALLLATGSWAQSAPDALADVKSFTADQLVAWVWEENPGIAELRAAAEVAVFRIEPAGSLDDPTFGYGFAPRTFGREGQGLNQKIEFSQTLPWPGTLAARKTAAEQEAAMAHEDINALRLQLAAAAKSAYAEWYYVERALTIHHATHRLLDELRSVAEARYAAGRASQQDALQAQVEQANLDRHLLQLKRIETSVQATINSLLNRDSSTPLPRPAEIATLRAVPTLAELERQALDVHPTLRHLDRQIAARAAQVTLAEKAFYPDFRLTAGYNSLWDEADKRPIVGVSINIPFGRSKRKATLSGAKADVRRAQSQRDNQRTQLLGEIARARAEVLETLDAVALYETSLLPLAGEYLEAALADYQSGTGAFLSVITAEQQKLATEDGLTRTRADLLRRQAELERWTGTVLDPQTQSLRGDRP